MLLTRPGGSMTGVGADRRCDHCGEVFPAVRRTARYCSARCRKRAQRAAGSAADVTLTPTGTDGQGSDSGTAKPQVSGTACHANPPRRAPRRAGGPPEAGAGSLEARIGTLPDRLKHGDGAAVAAARERWIAVLAAPGARGYPGDCARPGCRLWKDAGPGPAVKDGLCMEHLIESGGWQDLDRRR